MPQIIDTDWIIVLYRIVYERVSHNRTLSVFVVSCIWHGFYPGYYMAFFTVGLMVEAARKVCNEIIKIEV